MQDLTVADQIARLENAGPGKLWKISGWKMEDQICASVHFPALWFNTPLLVFLCITQKLKNLHLSLQLLCLQSATKHTAIVANVNKCAETTSGSQWHCVTLRLRTVGDRTFGVAAARVWNNLPLTIRSATSLNTFKRHLKTHLFHCSYSC